jgi:hypothetical protein
MTRLGTFKNPVETWIGYGPFTGWKFKVLRKYKRQPYDIWLCAIKSPTNDYNWNMDLCHPTDVTSGYMKRI